MPDDYYYWAFIDAEGDGANDILVLQRPHGTVSLLPDMQTTSCFGRRGALILNV